MIVHRKSLNCFVVFNHRIKSLLLELLPILAKLVLVIVIKHEQEVFDVGNSLLQLKITFGSKQMVSLFLKLSNAILSTFQSHS